MICSVAQDFMEMSLTLCQKGSGYVENMLKERRVGRSALVSSFDIPKSIISESA